MRKVVQFPKIIMIFNNNHFEFLPNLLQLGALYCETAVKVNVALQGHVIYPSIRVGSISPESFERFSYSNPLSETVCRAHNPAT